MPVEPLPRTVKRRTVLRSAAAGLAGLAGCVSTGDGPSPGSTDTATPTPTATRSPTATRTPTDSPTPTATRTPSPDSRRIVGRSFEVTGRECGTGEGGASVTLDAPRILVEGTAVGPNGCATARLDAASYDPETDVLTVSVRVYQPTDADVCTQCLTDVDYRACVRFEGGSPGCVRVVHDGEVVTETAVG